LFDQIGRAHDSCRLRAVPTKAVFGTQLTPIDYGERRDMGFYNGIYVGKSLVHQIRDWDHGPELDYLFAGITARPLTGAGARPFATNWRLFGGEPPEPDEEVLVIQIEARSLRERLDALGFGEQVIRDAIEERNMTLLQYAKSSLDWAKSERSQLLEDLQPEHQPRDEHTAYSSDDLDAKIREAQEQIESLQVVDFEAWAEATQYQIKSAPRKYLVEDMPRLWPFDDYADIRVVLAALVENVPGEKLITVDVTDENGNSRVQADRYGWFTASTSWDLGHEPAIVLTEGSFDAQALGYGMRLLRPHLGPFIKFFEHDLGVEGGAGAAIKTLKSFTAAGIRNRVVALLDNDSAAYEAALALRKFKLPEHFAVMHYPDLEIAKEYPTLGPQGDAVMDVNGLAGAIELYLGIDVLLDETGALSPVQWKGRMPGIKRYQGEIVDKALIQKRFLAKAKALERTPGSQDSHDWSGLNAIIDSLLGTLRRLPASGPDRTWNL
jgi:hypothetical protein